MPTPSYIRIAAAPTRPTGRASEEERTNFSIIEAIQIFLSVAYFTSIRRSNGSNSIIPFYFMVYDRTVAVNQLAHTHLFCYHIFVKGILGFFSPDVEMRDLVLGRKNS